MDEITHTCICTLLSHICICPIVRLSKLHTKLIYSTVSTREKLFLPQATFRQCFAARVAQVISCRFFYVQVGKFEQFISCEQIRPALPLVQDMHLTRGKIKGRFWLQTGTLAVAEVSVQLVDITIDFIMWMVSFFVQGNEPEICSNI